MSVTTYLPTAGMNQDKEIDAMAFASISAAGMPTDAPALPEQKLSELLTTALPYMTPVARARLGQSIAKLYSGNTTPAASEVASTDAVQSEAWGYSWDQERFCGKFDSRDAAIAEAKADRTEATHVYIAKARNPRQFISAKFIGHDIKERISECLTDEVGECAEAFTLSGDQEEKLGTLVLDWVESGPGFHCWGVEDVTQIELADYDADGHAIHT